jgi:hypothetical protein
VSWFLLTALAGAQDCDADALTKEMEEASPIAVSLIFTKLSACDVDAAANQTEPALQRLVADRDSHPAVKAMIEVGEGEQVRGWLAEVEPSDRSQLVAYLGQQCAGSKPVEAFLQSSHAALGPQFWDQRWHRGLADCRTEGIQGLLTSALDDPNVGRTAKDRAKFIGLLEVYANNLGAAAIPTLVEQVKATDNANEIGLLLSVFVDAANVSSGNTEAAKQAVKEIVTLAPDLPANAAPQARTALDALGAPDEASGFAQYRWPDRRIDGVYRYTAVATEIATCKNGKQYGVFHFGDFTNTGTRWPDQIAETLETTLTEQWSMTLADDCGGTGEIAVQMTEEPFAGDTEARKDWIGRELKSFQAQTDGFKKATDQNEPDFKVN